MVIPRALMGETKSRRELTRTGVYVLVGAPDGAGLPQVYVSDGYQKELRAALISNGVLKPTRDGYKFVQDYVFPSPSTAVGVVLGRAANGRVDWKTKAGLTLKELQQTDAKD